MSDQIASITLRADVADLKTASNELDKLGEAAAGAVGKADDLNSVFRAGAESTKQGTAGIKEQQTALKGLLENIDPVNKALNRLDEQQAALRNFQTKGFLDTDSFRAYSKILDDTRLKLTDTGEAAAKAQAELAATRAAEKQSAALKTCWVPSTLPSGHSTRWMSSMRSLWRTSSRGASIARSSSISTAFSTRRVSAFLVSLTYCLKRCPDRRPLPGELVSLWGSTTGVANATSTVH